MAGISRIWHMAIKDIRLVSRDRLGLFFITGFPIMMGLFFGSIMGGGGSSSGSGKMRVAIVDEDQTEISQSFLDSLQANDQLQLKPTPLEQARDDVRRGRQTAVVILPAGFSEKAGVLWNEPPTIQVGVDPSRKAEAAMLEGFLMQSMGQLFGQRLQNPDEMRGFLKTTRQDLQSSDANVVQKTLMTGFLDSIDGMLDSVDELQSSDDMGEQANDAMASGMQFADVQQIDVVREVEPGSQQALRKKIRSGWDISFPQAMLWGVLSCVAGFAISIARERSQGTLVRLQLAPASKLEILAGKGLACFLTVIAVIVMLTAIGVALGMAPGSYPKLIVACLCVAFCFVGLMMVISVLGKTEQGVGGAGWGINMVMAMIGGAMIPAVFLPGFMQTLSLISPVRWGIESLEGAIWRQYSWPEMLLPLSVLVVIGLAGTAIGTLIMKRH